MKQLFEPYHPEELVQTTRFINTPSDFAKRALFYVQETGYLKSLKSHLSKRSNLQSYLFLIVLSGNGTFTYKGQPYTLMPNNCILIDCMAYYTHQSNELSPWELLWVHFNGRVASDYYQYFTNVNDNIFLSETPEVYIDLLRQLIDTTRDKGPSWEITASKLITDLLTNCVLEKNINSHSDVELINRKLDCIKNYLDEHYTEKIKLDDIANNFYISKFHLSREYKRMFGTTIIDYLTMKRITHAKELLRFTNDSIENIAASSGYPDSSYFNKVFQKMEYITASEYRKKW